MLARAMTIATLGAASVVGVSAATATAADDPITPLQDIHAGLQCTARTVVQGTTISSFDVDVLDVVADTDGTGARILVRVSGPAVDPSGIAEGFSGSPVYCPNAQGLIGNAGAISATVGQYGENVGLVTPIEQMLGLPLRPPSGTRAAPGLLRNAHALATPLTLSGLSPSLNGLVQHVAAQHGTQLVTAPAGPLGTFAPQPLVPGASIGAAISSGAVAASAIGTVTYRRGSTVYAFGHELDGAGRRSLPLTDAYVYTVIANPLDTADSTSYKLAAPGHVLGTLSEDSLQGIVGTVGPKPPTIPVTVTVHDADRHRTVRQRTDVSQEVDVGEPTGESALSEIAPIAVAQGVTSVLDGATANESARLCVTVSLRETHKPLRFCDRYVLTGTVAEGDPAPVASSMSDDVTSALGALDSARFAKLHVTKVTADATVARGLALGTLLSAHDPHAARAGSTARVKARVRLYRGPERTLKLKVPIPRDLKAGETTIRLTGTAPDQPSDNSGLGDIVIDLGGGGSGSSQADGAQSLSALRSEFDGTARWDGVHARAGKHRWRALRNPDVRLEGSADFRVKVLPAEGRSSRRPAR